MKSLGKRLKSWRKKSLLLGIEGGAGTEQSRSEKKDKGKERKETKNWRGCGGN